MIKQQQNNRLKISGKPSLVWFARRFLRVLLIWLFACLILYLLIEILPGDAATVLAGKGGEKAVTAARIKMGLDRPWYVRCANWFGGLFTGDLGQCLTTDKPVSEVIRKPLLASLTVFVIVMLGLVLITVPGSLILGYRKNKVSAAFSTVSIAVSGVPEFITVIILLGVFAVGFKALPVLSIPGPGKTVWSRPITLVMPALSMWLVCSAAIYRRLCAMVRTYAGTSYIRNAELNGLSPMNILLCHLLPTIRSGIGQLLAQCVPYLLGGAVVIEYVTSFPGMGLTLTSAIDKRETPIIMAICSLLILISTISYALADYLMQKNARISEVA